MDILVLLKCVPIVGTERLGPDWLTDRAQLEANGADEYLLEKSLQLTEAHGGEVDVLTIGPDAVTDALRKTLAMGAARAWHVCDDAIAGSDIGATLRILAAAVGRLRHDLVFCGADTSDGQGGVLAAALAARLGRPYLSQAADIAPTDGTGVRVQRLTTDGHEVLEADLPAVVQGTQLLGTPRYPSFRGITAARSKEIVRWTLADLGIDPTTVGARAAATVMLDVRPPAERAPAIVVRADPDESVARIIDLLEARGIV